MLLFKNLLIQNVLLHKNFYFYFVKLKDNYIQLYNIDSQLVRESRVVFIPKFLRLKLKNTLMQNHGVFLGTQNTENAKEISSVWKSSRILSFFNPLIRMSTGFKDVLPSSFTNQ